MSEPDWLRLQKKIFTRYVQQKLRGGGSKTVVNNIIEDLIDGTVLLELAEILSGKSFTEKRPVAQKTRMGQIDNCNRILDWMTKTCGIKSQASPNDVVDKNEKLVLGMLFQIILKYMKFDDEGEGSSGDVKEALMLWLKNKTAGYKGVEISNFTKSFHNGLAFCALIHKMRPKLIPYDTLVATENMKNLALALDAGAKYCNVEKYLEPADIAKLDEVSMIVYLSDWYYGVALLQKQDVAAKRIGKLVLMTELHDKMRAEYNAGANQLKDWTTQKIGELNKRDFDNTLGGIQKRLEGFYSYKSTVKPTKISFQLDMISLFGNLAIRLVNNKRPPFQPQSPPEVLKKMFQDLESAEVSAGKAYNDELSRQLRLHKTAKRYQHTVEKVQAYVNEKVQYFKKTESIDSVEGAEDAVDDCKVETNETQNAQDTRLKDLQSISQELEKEQFENISHIKQLGTSLQNAFTSALNDAASKKSVLEGELKKQLQINDNLCKDFANAVNDFNNWLDSQKKSLEGLSGKSLEDQLSAINNLEGQKSAANPKLDAIKQADEKVKARQITNNPHTALAVGDCSSMNEQWAIMLQKNKELVVSQIEDKKKQGLTEEQLKEINDNFSYFDKDKTGFLEKRELRSCLQSLGEDSSPKAVDAVLKEYDVDGDQKLKFEEFMKLMMKNLGDADTEEEIIVSFKFLSYDRDVITATELTNVINDLSWKDRHVEYLRKEMKKKGEDYDFPQWTKEAFAR